MRVDETAHTPLRRITVQVNATTCLPRVEVSAKGPELTSRAGTVLLSALADRLGLTAGLTKALRVHTRLVRHEPGRVVRDLAVLLADGGDCPTDGGDCLTDLGALRDQEVLFGPLASDATAYRCLERLDAAALARIRTARAAARARAWKLDEAPRRLILDFDATLLTAHSDKEGVRGPSRVAAHQGAAIGGALGQLGEGELKHGNVVGGRIGSSVAGTQDGGESLTGAGLAAEQRVEAVAVRVGARRALLLEVRGEQGGVDVEDDAARGAGMLPGTSPGGGAGAADPREHALVEALEAAVGGGVRGDRSEEHLLVSERPQITQAVAAVGEQHGEVADHASGLVAHLARVAAQGLRQALREAQAVGQSAEQDGARA